MKTWMRKGIKRAFLKGIFEDISIDVSEGDTHGITVNVEEREFIKKVQIKGNYPLSAKEDRRAFPFKGRSGHALRSYIAGKRRTEKDAWSLRVS